MDPSFKHTLCRLCLFKSERLIDIFGMNGVHGYIAAEVIEDLLQFKAHSSCDIEEFSNYRHVAPWSMKLNSFEVTRSDGYPQSICSSCLDKLTEFKIFKDQCKGSLVAFENGFDPEKFHFAADGMLADSINFSPASLVKVEMMMPEAEDNEEMEHHIAFHAHYLDVRGDEEEGVGKDDNQETLPDHFSRSSGKSMRRGAGERLLPSWGADVTAGSCQQDGTVTLAEMVGEEVATVAGVTQGDDDAKPFGCGICGKRFARSNKLVQHIRTHTGERPFVCEICGRAFNRKDKLSLHRKTHNADKPYQCPTCLKSYCRSDYLLQHRKTAHPEEEVPHFPCTACGATFAKEKDLNAHVRTAHFSCADCGAAFGTEAELSAHAVSTNHSSGQQLDCVDCGKAFEDREKLRKHGKVHRRDAAYSCEWCGKVFYRMDKMLQHRRVHTKERPYRCDVCGKGFSRSDKMSEHRRIHDAGGTKPYECAECGKRFARSDYLLQHRKTHAEDAKKFKCATCDKGFVSSKDLLLHQGTHSTERPFSCELCGKSFKRKGALNTHRKGAHAATATTQQQAAVDIPWAPLKAGDILATYLQTPLA